MNIFFEFVECTDWFNWNFTVKFILGLVYLLIIINFLIVWVVKILAIIQKTLKKIIILWDRIDQILYWFYLFNS